MIIDLNNILERVRVLFMRYGIKSVTMDDIARELGVSKKTLYQYVEDKTDLVKKILHVEIEKRNHDFCLPNDNNLNAIEELISVNQHINEMIKDYNPSCEYDLKKYYTSLYKKFIENRREKMFQWVLNNLIKGKKEGLYREDLDEIIIAKLYVLRIESIHETEMIPLNEFTSYKFYNELMTYHIRGIANKKGIDFFEKNWKPL
jgi:TetR/AcrR family transcriptional regulator, cholesterol catabolism regulator